MRDLLRIFCVICAMAPCASLALFDPTHVVPFPSVPATNPAIGAGTGGFSGLRPTAFPKTAADLGAADRVALKAESYAPYQDSHAYHDLVVESEEEFTERQRAMAEFQSKSDYATMDIKTYCENYPLDDEHCVVTSDAYDNVVSIGNAEHTTAATTPQYSGATIGGGPVVANNSTRGGSCYPAAKNDHFKDEILTTGKYERISPAFEKALMTLFRKEGKCGYTPGDACGYTCYGIGENCLGKSIGLDRAALERLTRGEAEDIYYRNYWEKYNMKILPDVIAGDLFLAMMGSGAVAAIRQFRKFLNVNTSPKDKLDENVVAAVQNYNGDIHNRWLDFRQDFLVKISGKYNPNVLTAWMRGIKLKRENGCHVVPSEPLYR